MTGPAHHQRVGSSVRAGADPATEEAGARAAEFSSAAPDRHSTSGSAHHPTMTATSSQSHQPHHRPIVPTLTPPVSPPGSPYRSVCQTGPLELGRRTSAGRATAGRCTQASHQPAHNGASAGILADPGGGGHRGHGLPQTPNSRGHICFGLPQTGQWVYLVSTESTDFTGFVT